MSEETIFREVDEELRGDRARALWRNFGPYLIGAAVLVVLAVAGNEGWSWWQKSNATRSSDMFYGALESAEAGEVGAAKTALDDVIANGSGGYPTLARFREAALLASEGKSEEAIAAYDALSTAESNPRLRQLALIFAGSLLVDGGDVAAVEQRVGGLNAPDNPLRNTARELIGLTQYQAGDLNAALETLTEVISDPLVSNQVRQRVTIYVAQLVAQGALTPEQQAQAAAAPATPAEVSAPISVVPDAMMDLASPDPAAAISADPVVPEATPAPEAMTPAPEAMTPAPEAMTPAEPVASPEASPQATPPAGN